MSLTDLLAAILLPASLLVTAPPLTAQPLESEFFYPALPTAGLARANAAATWINPAGLTGLRATVISALAAQLYHPVGLQYVGVSLAQPWPGGTVGVLLTHFGSGDYQQQRLAGQYARPLTDAWSLGTEVALHHTAIRRYGHEWQPAVSLGTQLQLAEAIRLGARLRLRYPGAPDLAIGLSYTPAAGVALLAEITGQQYRPPQFRAVVSYRPHAALLVGGGIGTAPVTWTAGAAYRLRPACHLQLGLTAHPRLGYSSAIGLLLTPPATAER